MVSVDPVLVVLVAVMLLFVFGVYLFVRRTVLGFSEGYGRGRE
jgi:branched-subunit amino acid ABC-type transport system permease component